MTLRSINVKWSGARAGQIPKYFDDKFSSVHSSLQKPYNALFVIIYGQTDGRYYVGRTDQAFYYNRLAMCFPAPRRLVSPSRHTLSPRQDLADKEQRPGVRQVSDPVPGGVPLSVHGPLHKLCQPLQHLHEDVLHCTHSCNCLSYLRTFQGDLIIIL